MKPDYVAVGNMNEYTGCRNARCDCGRTLYVKLTKCKYYTTIECPCGRKLQLIVPSAK